MPLFVYPGAGSTPGGSFPTITAGNPSSRQYDATSSQDGNGVQLPVFTITGSDPVTVTFNLTGGTGQFDFGDALPSGVTTTDNSVTGPLASVQTVLNEIYFFPDEGSTQTITYNATIVDSTTNTGTLATDCDIFNKNVSVPAKQAETTLTIGGTTGTIQLTFNGTNISGVVTFNTDLDQVATDLANSVNSYASTPKFTAQDLVGGSLNVTGSNDAGGQINGMSVSANVTGDLTLSGGAFAGGVTAVAPPPTKLDSVLKGIEGVLPTLGAGLVGSLLYHFLGQGEVTTNVSSATETPDIGVIYQGLIINVPNNFNATTLTYTGQWDYATFQQVYCNDPAWCLLDYVQSKRYGCGNDIIMTSAQWTQFYKDLYQASLYNNQMLPDGKGGSVPRFQLNVALTGQTKLATMQSIASNMLAQVIFTPTGLRLMQDRPSSAMRCVSNASVENGVFTMSGTSMLNAYNNVEVSWDDATNLYVQSTAFVFDAADISQTWERDYQATAPGVTNLAQAKRYGNWVIQSNKSDPQVVSYTAGWDHYDLIPGNVVLLLDNHSILSTTPWNAGGRLLGSANSTTITLDRPYNFPSGAGYITLNMPDGTIFTSQITQVQNATSSTPTLTLSSAMPMQPAPNAIWITLDPSLFDSYLYKILTISEKDVGVFDVSAVRFSNAKYSIIDTI